MKLRVIFTITVVASVILMCTGIAISLYLRMSITEKAEDFNLYTVVPQSSVVILDTDDVVGLIKGVNELNCSKDNNFLYASRLFSHLKDHINTLLEDVPHGLSRQMSRLLISFHEPGNDKDQVVYCRLGAGDHELVEKFIKTYCASDFPSKYFDYRGEEIRIYPVVGDEFLACYFTSEFLAISYQKKLIEEVIDARVYDTSILNDETFLRLRAEKAMNSPATVYFRMQPMNMGKESDGIPSPTILGNWTEFNMQMNGDAIYFSGVNYDQDTCVTFMNTLRKQAAIDGFPGEILPYTTFFFSNWSISDLRSLFRFTSQHEYARSTYSNYIMERDEELLDFLDNHAYHSLTTCFFSSPDSVHNSCAVVRIPIRNAKHAEQALTDLLQNVSWEKNMEYLPQAIFNWPYTFRLLPRNTLFTQLTGVTGSGLQLYSTFYRGQLLIGSSLESLSAYISMINAGEVLAGDYMYEKCVGSLSDSYNFMMMADLQQVFGQPESYVRLIPNFFFLHHEFFCNFMFSTQFTCIDGVIYPNIVLLYKGQSN